MVDMRDAGARGEDSASFSQSTRAPAELPVGTWLSANAAASAANPAELARARLAELEERMEFLSGLEKSLTDLARDPTERMEAYLNSPLRNASRDDGAEDLALEEEGNPGAPRSHVRGPGKTTLPNAVNTDSDGDDDAHSHDSRPSPHADPHRGKELFRRNTVDLDSTSVEDMTIGDLRGIIRQEVVDKAREMQIVGGDLTKREPSNFDGSVQFTSSQSVTSCSRLEDPHLAAPTHRLPRTLDEAIPVTLPYFFRGFSRTSPIRIKCFRVCCDEAWTVFFLLNLLANCTYIAMRPDDPNFNTGAWEVFDNATNIIYGFEIMCNLVAYGFVGRNAWFSVSYFNKLEFLILIAVILETIIATYMNIEGLTLRPFRLMRLMPWLVSFQVMANVKIILSTLSLGAPQLLVVCVVFALFVCGFGIFLTQTMMYSFRNRCVFDDRDINGTICASNSKTGWGKTCDFRDQSAAYPVPGGDRMLRGSGFPGAGYDEVWCKVYCYTKEECKVWETYGRKRSCSDDCFDAHPTDKRCAFKSMVHSCIDFVLSNNQVDHLGLPLYPRDRWGRVHSCPQPHAYCEAVGNPMYGLQHFDNVGGFIPSTLQLAMPDSAYSIIHQGLQSEPEEPAVAITWSIILTIISMCTWLLSSLFIAVVTGTFERAREKYRVKRRTTAKADMDKSAELDKGEANFERDAEDPHSFKRIAVNIVYETEFPMLMNLVVVVHIAAMIVQVDIPNLASSAKILQYIAYGAFVLESILTFIASGGVWEYLKEGSHRIETILVVLSIVSFFPNCEFLGFFCAARIFRLTKYWDTLYGLLSCAASSAQAILSLVFFSFLLSFCFAVTGRYVFGNLMNENTRSHFGSNSQALLTIFQLMVGDSWSSVMYECMRVAKYDYSRIFAAAYIVLWFVFAKLVLSNIFVAVIIDNFEVTDTMERASRPGYMHKIRSSISDSYKAYYAWQVGRDDPDLLQAVDTYKGLRLKKKNLHYSLEADEHETEMDMQFRNVRKNPHLRSIVVESVLLVSSKTSLQQNEEPERVLFCLGPEDFVRNLFATVVRSRMFEALVYIVIAVSCLILITTPPYDDIPSNPPWVPYSLRVQLEWVFTGIFTLEFICRVVSDGLCFTRQAYFKDLWNVIDFTVLIAAWIEVLELFEGTKLVKVIRVMRALKPLRMVTRFKALRHLIDAMFITLLPVFYVLTFLAFVCFVFAIVGMGMFADRMFKCTDSVGAAYPAGKTECASFFTTDAGIVMPRAWLRPPHNFDSLNWAYLSLGRMSTAKYVGILADLQDITYMHLSPKKEFSMGHSLYVVAYLIVGLLFTMNLLVAFIVDGFNINQNASEHEKQYRRLVRYTNVFRPKATAARPPAYEISARMREIAAGFWFNRISMLFVLANAIILTADHTEPAPGWLRITGMLEYVFFAELCFEVIVNMVGYGIGGYLSDPWKVFDLIVVLMSTIGFLYTEASTVGVFARASRAIRILRLMRMISSLRVILETLASSIPQFKNILGVFVLFIFIFAAAFMQLFATTRSGRRIDGGKRFERQKTASFDNFWDSVATLFQMLISDEWMTIMDDNAVQYPECTQVFRKSDDPSNSMYYYQGPDYYWGDCGLYASYLAFPIFIIFCQSVLLNLVIGMILDNFSFITDQIGAVDDPDWNGGATAPQIVHLASIFSAHAGESQFLPLWAVTALLRDMPEPIGFRAVKNPSVVIWGGRERTAEKLIRAQLNVIVKSRRQNWHLAHSGDVAGGVMARIRRLGLKLFSSREEHTLDYIDFHEFILTAVAWRKPTLLPVWVKRERGKKFKEFMLTYSGLIVKDAVARNLALKLKKDNKRAFAALAEFSEWAQGDQYWRRRIQFRRLRNQECKERARTNALYRGIREMPPVANREVMLEMLEDIPPGMIPHHQSVRWESSNRFPCAIHGVQWFLKQAAVNKVVMRFIDIRNGSIDLVKADFTQCDWHGWIEDGTEDDVDYLFRPQMKKLRVDYDDVDWIDVSFVMRPSAKAGGGRRRRSTDPGQADDANSKQRLVQMGSIVDVQGYASYSELNPKNKPKDPTSVVRINLGAQLFDGELRERPRTGFVMRVSKASDKQHRLKKIVSHHRDSKVKVMEGVLEVVGYMGHVQLGLQWQEIRREQAQKGTQINNSALAGYLQGGKLQFTREEFASMRIANMTWSSYVRVSGLTGEKFFSPVAQVEGGKTKHISWHTDAERQDDDQE